MVNEDKACWICRRTEKELSEKTIPLKQAEWPDILSFYCEVCAHIIQEAGYTAWDEHDDRLDTIEAVLKKPLLGGK